MSVYLPESMQKLYAKRREEALAAHPARFHQAHGRRGRRLRARAVARARGRKALAQAKPAAPTRA